MRPGEKGGSQGKGTRTSTALRLQSTTYFIKLKVTCWLVPLLINLLAPNKVAAAQLVLSWVPNPEPGQGAGQSNDQGLLSGFPYLDLRALAPSSASGCCSPDEDRPACHSCCVPSSPPPRTTELLLTLCCDPALQTSGLQLPKDIWEDLALARGLRLLRASG